MTQDNLDVLRERMALRERWERRRNSYLSEPKGRGELSHSEILELFDLATASPEEVKGE